MRVVFVWGLADLRWNRKTDSGVVGPELGARRLVVEREGTGAASPLIGVSSIFGAPRAAKNLHMRSQGPSALQEASLLN